MSDCPRLTEFMLLGYDLATALKIRIRWESLSVREKKELGFTSFPPLEQEPQETARSDSRTVGHLRVLQGGLRSVQDSEQHTQGHAPDEHLD